MPNVYKVLGQQAPGAASLEDLYEVPADTQAVVSTITVCNRSATATTFRIAVRVAGAGVSNAAYIAYDAEILGNEIYTFTIGATLDETDVISVYATLATLSFSAFGQEISP